MHAQRLRSDMLQHGSQLRCHCLTQPFARIRPHANGRQRDTARLCSTVGSFAGRQPHLLLPQHRSGRGTPVGGPRCSAAATVHQTPFQEPPPLQGLPRALESLPPPVALFGAALLVALSGAGGALLGNQLPAGMRLAGRVVGGLVGLAVGKIIVDKLKEQRAAAAVNELYRLLAAKSDPGSLTAKEVEEIESRFGVKLDEGRQADLQIMYGMLLESIIPRGESPLSGREAEVVRSFKDALRISDEAAAEVHLDVGRRLTRAVAEGGSREASTRERKTFQKLIFVSGLVFGEQKSAFLLPWRRVFNMTDSQVTIAKRDSAKALFKTFLDARGGHLQADREQLLQLGEYQTSIGLGDDVASEIVKEAARARVEADLDAAVECIRKRTAERDYSAAVDAVSRILQFNRQLEALKGDGELVPGVGRTSVWGGKYDSASGEGKARDLRDLFKIVVEERLRRDGEITAELEADLAELQAALGLGPKEAAGVRSEVVSAAYKRLLREEFRSGRLAAASSKAAALQALCDRLKFDPNEAAAINRDLFTERIETFLEDEKLTDSEAEELATLRRLLCIPADTYREIELATKGRIFQAAVTDALGAGIDSFGFDDRNAVKRVREAVRLDERVAKQILADTARKAFLGFVSRARMNRNKLDGAKELKKMVFFSNIVVAPMLEDMQTKEEREADDKAAEAAKAAKEAEAEKGRQMEKAKEELARLMAKAKEQADAEDRAAVAKAAGEDADEPASATEETASPAEAEDSRAEASPETTAEAAAESAAEPEASKAAEVQPTTLAKAQSAAAERELGEEVGDTGIVMRSQKEVTLANDLELRDRLDIYRNFLLYCLSGEVVALPMGSTVVVERDSSEFARLAQLGDVLGLTPMDVGSVHSKLAEESFRHQVQVVMGDGNLNKERMDALAEMRQKMGLSEEAAGRVIKGVQNQRLIGNLQAVKASGALTLDKVLDMADAGVDVDSFISAQQRLDLYAKHVAEQLSSGTGNFDEGHILEDLPKKLKLADGKARTTVQNQAKDRKRTTLVQAISYLRQKQLGEVATSLNNLLACEKAQPSERPVKWDPKAELQDLYSSYLTRVKDEDKRQKLAAVLGIEKQEAQSLQGLVEAGQFKLEQEAKEQESFF